MQLKPREKVLSRHLECAIVDLKVLNLLYSLIALEADYVQFHLSGLCDLFLLRVDYQVLGCPRFRVRRSHVHELNTLSEAALDGEQLVFELLNVLFAVSVHLLHDLFLSVDVSLQVLLLGQRFIDLVLQARVLLGENFIGACRCLKFYLNVLGCENLVLEGALGMEQVGVCGGVLLLLFLVALDPDLPRFLLVGKHLLEVGDFLGELFLRYLGLPLQRSLFHLQVFVCALQVDSPAVHILKLLCSFVQLFVLVSDHILQRPRALLLLRELELGFVAHLVGNVKLLNCVLQVVLAHLILFFNLVVLYS